MIGRLAFPRDDRSSIERALALAEPRDAERGSVAALDCVRQVDVATPREVRMQGNRGETGLGDRLDLECRTVGSLRWCREVDDVHASSPFGDEDPSVRRDGDVGWIVEATRHNRGAETESVRGLEGRVFGADESRGRGARR